ncbi:hypothetical protein NFI96_005940 [Prochilodus magdalenae]|nr:hypothetical protein NFI96_005940 [Prochilodus magdalenae]
MYHFSDPLCAGHEYAGEVSEVECRGPLTKSGTRQPPIRAYMDDLTVTTTSVPGCRWILQGLERLITWARMDFKPVKSRSLVLRKGKVTDKFRFFLGGVRIPSVSDKPVKSLEEGHSAPAGWLGLPRSLSSIALYGRKTKVQLPFNSLSEEFKVTRAREVLSYRDSTDNKVAAAGIEVRTGRKWRAQEAVDQAEARLRHSVLVGTVAVGRAGLGNKPRPLYNQVQGKERLHLVQDEVRAEAEEAHTSQMVGMRQQGAWMRWEQALDRKITCPSNLFCWGLAETPACPLCQRRGSLEHILSCCPKALGEGRYRWRHDQAGEKGERCPSQGGSWQQQETGS